MAKSTGKPGAQAKGGRSGSTRSSKSDSRAGYGNNPKDRGYVDGGYDARGYNDPGYDDRGYDDRGYDDRGYNDPGYQDTGYQDGGSDSGNYGKGQGRDTYTDSPQDTYASGKGAGGYSPGDDYVSSPVSKGDPYNQEVEDNPSTGYYSDDPYSDNEPIQDPPYDGYDDPVSKQPGGNGYAAKGGGDGLPDADMVFTEEEVYGNSSQPEADMVFTEEEVYGEGPRREEGTSQPQPRGDVFDRSATAFGQIRFRNARDIDQFFADNSDQPDFMSWFGTHIGGRGPWQHRRFGRISAENRSRFSMVWDRIPLIYRGRSEEYSINLFQFLGLVSIMINEVGQTFTPIRERGSLRYMFGTIIPASRTRPQRSKRSYNDFGRSATHRNNKTAYELFNDPAFLEAHRDEALYERVARTTDRVWDGHVYPNGFPTDPDQGGIITQADFYKFSGRGLVQTTWSGAYMRLIDATLQYEGSNRIILEYRNAWRGKRSSGLSIRDIASQTKNSDWDRLFMETNNEFACLAVYCFQHAKNDFLQIPTDAARLQATQTASSGSGSIFYVGYRVGGSRRYGELVRERVMQMLSRLLHDTRQA